jgi:predicted nucleic acid-binding protein
VIAYLDSSVLARAYLADEDGHEHATQLLADPKIATVTGTWARIEVSGALIRAARSGRGDAEGLLALLDADLSADGPVSLLGAPQDQVEDTALQLVREHAIRAMDAWHLAAASLLLPGLAEPGEQLAFASRDAPQSLVATTLGFTHI